MRRLVWFLVIAGYVSVAMACPHYDRDGNEFYTMFEGDRLALAFLEEGYARLLFSHEGIDLNSIPTFDRVHVSEIMDVAFLRYEVPALLRDNQILTFLESLLTNPRDTRAQMNRLLMGRFRDTGAQFFFDLPGDDGEEPAELAFFFLEVHPVGERMRENLVRQATRLDELYEVDGPIIKLRGAAMAQPFITSTEMESLAEPFEVRIQLDGFLSPDQARSLVGVRYDVSTTGELAIERVPGEYDPFTQAFVFQTQVFGVYGVLSEREF